MRSLNRLNKKEKHNQSHDLTPEEINEMNETELNKNPNSDFGENTYNFLSNWSGFLLRTIIFLTKISGFYLLWICLHYFSSHLYVKFCVPNTIVGFIMSPFMISTPHCQGLRWIIYNAANIINHMWIIVGAWIYSLIWIVKGDNSSDMSS